MGPIAEALLQPDAPRRVMTVSVKKYRRAWGVSAATQKGHGMVTSQHTAS